MPKRQAKKNFKFDLKKLGQDFTKKRPRGKKKNKRKKRVDNRGNYPYHLFVKADDPQAESKIQSELAQRGGLDVRLIDQMIDGTESREEAILRRVNENEKLSKIDQIRYENIKNKEKELIDSDINNVQKAKHMSNPKTKEGRFMKIMLWVEHLLKKYKDNIFDKDLIKNILVKLAHLNQKINDEKFIVDQLFLPDNLKEKYNDILIQLIKIISKIDLVDTQLNELNKSLVPLNQQGFVKLDPFQVRVIELIRENKKNILVNAPTSSGKTILATYLFTKEGRFIVSVPTNALAWQVAATISEIIGVTVPVITDTYQSRLNEHDLVKKIIDTKCVVGTPKELVDILVCPEFSKIHFDYLLLDEIHMLGYDCGREMEHLIKYFSNEKSEEKSTKILALSATIGNTRYLANWIQKCSGTEVEVVTHDKRFITVRRHRWVHHILSMVSEEDFKSSEVLNKNIIPTSDEVYELYKILKEKYPKEKKISPKSFLNKDKVITSEKVLPFFNHLLKFMISKVKGEDKIMKDLIKTFDGEFESINPLSMVSIDEFRSGEVLNKTIVPTPSDAYQLYTDLKEIYPEEDSIKHENFFDENKRLSLDDSLEFFNHHLQFMIEKVRENDQDMIDLINSYDLEKFDSSEFNLTNLIFKLKEEKRNPSLIFDKNSSRVCKHALNIYNELLKKENEKYPKLYAERMKHNKKYKAQKKKEDREKVEELGEKQKLKLAQVTSEKSEEKIDELDLYAPHPDFVLTSRVLFDKGIMLDWEFQCNPNREKYFARDGERIHWMISLLYRGIGIYCKGLPDPYLRIVQKYANLGKLAIVLSDQELVFGVSMPFRTVVILNDDTLNSMETHQMFGRAGRRGLDKEGNVIWVGFSSERIEELSISPIPDVTGSEDNINYGLVIAEKLSGSSKWSQLSKNMLYDEEGEESSEFFESVNFNIDNVWDFVHNIDNKYLLHLMWQFRHTDFCIMLPQVLNILEAGFQTAQATDQGEQISIAHFLLHFMCIYETDDTTKKLELHPFLLKNERYMALYNILKDEDNGYAFDISDNIDNQLYLCIRENRCIECSFDEKHKLRNRLFEFISQLKFIQHYYYYMGKTAEEEVKNKYVNITKLLGKLFTRMKWIYFTSSYLAVK